MIGPLPTSVVGQIKLAPNDFAIVSQLTPTSAIWRGNLIVESGGVRETIPAEVACRFSTEIDTTAALEQLRQIVWHIKELARLGYRDGLKGVRTDRHSGHPISTPQPLT